MVTKRYRRGGGRPGDGWADSTVGGLRRYGGWQHCESFVMNSSRDPLPTECEEEAKGNTLSEKKTGKKKKTRTPLVFIMYAIIIRKK